MMKFCSVKIQTFLKGDPSVIYSCYTDGNADDANDADCHSFFELRSGLRFLPNLI